MTTWISWGRAGYEPQWMITANKIGLITVAIAAWRDSGVILAVGVILCAIVGFGYLYLVWRALKLGYIQPPGITSIALERDRRKYGRL